MRALAVLSRFAASRTATAACVFAAALAAAAAGGASVARSELSAPSLATPPRGAVVQALPAFGWRGVAGADHYEFQIAADPGFNSVVGRDSFATHNTWATPRETIPNGQYWWHVRAITPSGGVSGWSEARPIRKQWSSAPKLRSPVGGAEIRFPTTPLVLRWSPVPFAGKYLVYLASDTNLVNLVGDGPVETQGVSYSPSVTLADRHTYYWAVVPVDAGGNKGVRSRVASFTWRWYSNTTVGVQDLVPATEHYDPQISWKPVPGAARYEIEINPSKEWTVGSKVCCRNPVVTTSFSPVDLLPNNRYYYRVRAINVAGNAGTWNPSGEGTLAFSFNKVFDNYEGTSQATIKNLRLLDNYGNALSPGGATTSPIVMWDAVPGASKYEVVLRGPSCPIGRTAPPCDTFTAVPAWTPLALRNLKPYPVPQVQVAEETPLAPGAYSVNVRAYTDKSYDGKEIFGNFSTSGFNLVGYPRGGGALGPSTYLAPVNGHVERWTPVFRWQLVAGAVGYWVIVAKDRSFTTVTDYAYTKIPAYAPRQGFQPTTYPDEETRYYWAILPDLGSSTPVDPNSVASESFEKRSLPPSVIQPARDGSRVLGPPTFRWTPATGAKYYQLQVSQDRNFGTLLDDIKTHSTAYTSTKTYPANAALYFRVRAVDENEIGLTWSTPRVLRDSLAKPVLAKNAGARELLPTWVWHYVPGALSYDVHVDLPGGGSGSDFSDNLTTALTPTRMNGTGTRRWQVRAEFPQPQGGRAVGPYTRALAFTWTIRPPTGTRVVAGGRSLLLSWAPKIGADHYVVQVAGSPDFQQTVDSVSTANTSYAPDLGGFGWAGHATFYWRVAAGDAGGNTGNYSPVRTFGLHLPSSR